MENSKSATKRWWMISLGAIAAGLLVYPFLLLDLYELGRHNRYLDADVMNGDIDSVIGAYYSDHHRLPNPEEYSAEYRAQLKKGDIVDPLPNGWSVTCKALPTEPSYNIDILVELLAGGKIFRHTVTFRK